MIYVVATITLKPGCREDFLKIFKSIVPIVRNEAGCIEFNPTVDYEMGGRAQDLDENVIVNIEKWESPEALDTHSHAPHIAEYQKKTAHMKDKVHIRILQDA